MIDTLKINQMILKYGAQKITHEKILAFFHNISYEDSELIFLTVSQILNDLDEIKPNWEKHNLVEAATFAIETVSKKYPFLQEKTLEYLKNSYAFGYK